MPFEQCIKESRNDNKLTRPHLQNPGKHSTGPENGMPIHLVQELPPSGGYQIIVTAIVGTKMLKQLPEFYSSSRLNMRLCHRQSSATRDQPV